MADSYSIVEYYGLQTQRQCGYCNCSDTNCSHGMWAHYLTVQDYQNLIDRGWRRSGRYCYKPTMDQSCCPMYTIRCEALDFKITKSQKKILKRMAKFLRNELKKDCEMGDSKVDTPDNIEKSIIEVPNYEEHCSRAERNKSEMTVTSVEGRPDSRLRISSDAKPSSQNRSSGKKREDVRSAEKSTTSNSAASGSSNDAPRPIHRAGQDLNRTPPKKAKLMRAERKHKKLVAQGKTAEEIESLFRVNKQNVAKSVEDLFNEIHGGVQKLETKLVRVMSLEFFETVDVSANLYKKYQMAIHENQPSECDKKSFLNFLVKSPLQPCTPPDGPPEGYGSFHEQYWLNGELIAVAVIDILPHCVSSVYFFYDPDYAFLSLGTFSSLREVCLTRQLNKAASRLRYYYMGFYIHSNVKMRYKAKIKPSMLLCPETYAWCDIERSIAKIDKEKYSRLNDNIDAIDEDGVVDLFSVMVLYHHKAMTYEMYTTRNGNESEDEMVKEYASVVGMKCARSMLLYRK